MINDEEHGVIIYVGGVVWYGILSHGGGYWTAYKHDDPLRTLVYVKEDE